MVLKIGHFTKYIGNTLKCCKFGAEEAWRIPLGQIV
jgi:hypothetical protein